MSITASDLITDFNTYIGDASTDRISAAQRLSFVTEATAILCQQIKNDHMVATVEFNFYDTVHYYKMNTSLPDLIETADLRIADEDDQIIFFTKKSSQELAIEIGEGSLEEAYAIDRRDTNLLLGITHYPKYSAQKIASFTSITEDGTWTADTTNSDALNLTIDTNEFKEGSASLNFDIDVSQSGNNRATIYNSTHSSMDMTQHEDLSSHLVDVYIPDVTNFTSITLYWGTDSSNYWSATATTDINGSAFVAGWNLIKIDWANATKTATPDITDTVYFRMDFNYGAGQADDTDFRIDNWRICRPEKLRLHYLSWNVGTSNAGAEITAFTATNDVPFFSGKYDHYRWFVSHKAAALAFRSMRQLTEAQIEDNEAKKFLPDFKVMFPRSLTSEVKNFKIRGLSFRRRRTNRLRNI